MTRKPTYEELETRIKELEEEAAESDQTKGDLAPKVRKIGHDFNNILMGIQGYTSLMLLDADPSHPHFEHLRGIEEYVRNATDLTNRLMSLAKPKDM